MKGLSTASCDTGRWSASAVRTQCPSPYWSPTTVTSAGLQLLTDAAFLLARSHIALPWLFLATLIKPSGLASNPAATAMYNVFAIVA